MLRRRFKATPLALVFVLGLVTIELALRAGSAFRLPVLADPDWYTDWTSDDDYWKLRHMWKQRVTARAGSLEDSWDPYLGWSTPKTATNPLGAATESAYIVEPELPTLLFVGDSFIRGSSAGGATLSQRVGKELGITAYNLGERGYGWDQEFLKYQEARRLFRKPTVVAGLLSVGLDRGILRFRTGLKPYFSVVDDDLRLRGVPVPKDLDAWLIENPPRLGLYTLSLLARKFRLWNAGGALEIRDHRAEKQDMARRLLAHWTSEARAWDQPLLYILFYNQEELQYEGWREAFILNTLKKLKAPYLDTKALFLRAARETGIKISDLYSKDGLLSERGNSLVAKAVSESLRKTAQPSRAVN